MSLRFRDTVSFHIFMITYKIDQYIIVQNAIYDNIKDHISFALFLNNVQPIKLNIANTTISLFKYYWNADYHNKKEIKLLIYNLCKTYIPTHKSKVYFSISHVMFSSNNKHVGI